jgi:hypothetical protein
MFSIAMHEGNQAAAGWFIEEEIRSPASATQASS